MKVHKNKIHVGSILLQKKRLEHSTKTRFMLKEILNGFNVGRKNETLRFMLVPFCYKKTSSTPHRRFMKIHKKKVHVGSILLQKTFWNKILN